MKTALLTIILAVALTSHAGQENFGTGGNSYRPEAIYKALKVKERRLNSGMGVAQFSKSVGGLTCVRGQAVVPGAKLTFECSINQAKENFSAIYKALNVTEVSLNPGMGVVQFSKSVGGLTCVREQIVVPGAKPTFDCQIAE